MKKRMVGSQELYELRGNLEVAVELFPRTTKNTVFFAII
jgi:hypothetical protein